MRTKLREKAAAMPNVLTEAEKLDIIVRECVFNDQG
jgi:hypothetical protein